MDVLHVCPQIRIRKIAPKILQFLTEWTDTFPYDFRDERMMRSLKELTHRLASGDEVSPPTGPGLSQSSSVHHLIYHRKESQKGQVFSGVFGVFGLFFF